MMQVVGWMKFYRKIQENWIWQSDEPYCMRSAWDYILFNVKFSDSKISWRNQTVEIKRGQMITSLRELANEWKWSTGKVTRFLNKLEKENMILKEDAKSGTLLTVVNYEVYQGEENTNETPTEHKRNTNETPTKHQRNTLKKEDKEEKEKKNIKEYKENEEYKEDKEFKKYNIYNNINNTVCTEPKDLAHAPEAIITLTLNDKSEYPFFQKDIDEFAECYPSVDILGELRKMKGWCANNPTKRKTKRGIRRFANSWLSREQDKPKPQGVKDNINKSQQTQLDWLMSSIREDEQNEPNGNQEDCCVDSSFIP